MEAAFAERFSPTPLGAATGSKPHGRVQLTLQPRPPQRLPVSQTVKHISAPWYGASAVAGPAVPRALGREKARGDDAATPSPRAASLSRPVAVPSRLSERPAPFPVIASADERDARGGCNRHGGATGITTCVAADKVAAWEDDGVEGSTADIFVCNLFPERQSEPRRVLPAVSAAQGLSGPPVGLAFSSRATSRVDSTAAPPPEPDAPCMAAQLILVNASQQPEDSASSPELDSGLLGALGHTSGGGAGGDSMADLERLASELASLCAGAHPGSQHGAESETEPYCEQSGRCSPDGSALGSAESEWRSEAPSSVGSDREAGQPGGSGRLSPFDGPSAEALHPNGEVTDGASESASDSGSDSASSAFVTPGDAHCGNSGGAYSRRTEGSASEVHTT